jgi:hypothetical protein
MTAGISAYRDNRAANNEMPCSPDPIISRTVKSQNVLHGTARVNFLCHPLKYWLTRYWIFKQRPLNRKVIYSSFMVFRHVYGPWPLRAENVRPSHSLEGQGIFLCPAPLSKNVRCGWPYQKLGWNWQRQVIWGANVECWVSAWRNTVTVHGKI